MKSSRVPEGLKLRDYQVTGVNHLMSGQRKLLFDDVGLGKTAQALVALNTLGAKTTLVLCPPATRYGWEEEAKRWTDRDYKVHVMTKENEWIPKDVNILIVAYSLLNSVMMVDQLKERRWSVTIMDEIHYLKSSKAKRTKNVLGRGGIATKSVYLWGLSATPMNNAPIDLWQIFRSMGKEHLPPKCQDWMGYTRYFCQRYKDPRGQWNVSGAANLEVLNKALFDSGFAERRTKEEVLDELPEKEYRIIPMVEGSRSAEIKWGETLRSERLRLEMDAGQLAEARKELGEAKIKAVVEFLKDIDQPTVVFGWHREFLEMISEAVDGALYYGSMSVKKKEEQKQKFLDGKSKFFVANILSAGTGLNGLQHISSRCVFAELPWTYSEIDQASGRLHRMGQKDSVLADMLCVKGGVEEYMMKKIIKKQKYFKTAIDNKQKLITI
jgi:SWI/SNF-related matrix-associated actin-dependent regulator 1 of chromatin subfamily A